MIASDQKHPFRDIFRIHSADTFAKLAPYIVLLFIYTAAIALVERAFLHLTENSPVRQISNMHTLLGFAISMLLVFRTNTAYDRWWEGRKLWGNLTNSSRNLTMKLASILGDKYADDLNTFKKLITAYAYALHDHLKKENTRTALFDDKDQVKLFDEIDGDKHIPNQIASIMMRTAQSYVTDKKITEMQLLYINEELKDFTDICGACERIKNTPIPFSYSVFIKKFIFVYIVTLPFPYVLQLGYWAIPVVGFIFYVLASLELIAEEIEDPFGTDANDLPTEKIATNIGKHIADIN